MMTDLGIVIVNWNTRDLLLKCLQTVFASTGDLSFSVVVVDNASSDGSAQKVAEQFPQVRLIREQHNRGYPAANNRGLCALGFVSPGEPKVSEPPRMVLLLNPDTELPPDGLATLVEYIHSDARIGAAGPRLTLPGGKLDLACRRSFPSPEVSFWRMIGFARLFPKSRRFGRYNLTFLDEYQMAEVDSLVGACMMVRREAIQQVGLLDESFFMYGEDLDWCKRIKEAGFKVMYYPQVEVLHVKRAASARSPQAAHEFVRAMLIFYNKHYRARASWLTNIAVLAGIALRGGPRLWPEILGVSSPPRGGVS